MLEVEVEVEVEAEVEAEVEGKQTNEIDLANRLVVDLGARNSVSGSKDQMLRSTLVLCFSEPIPL